MATGVDFLPFSTSTLPSIASSAVVSGAGERSFPSGFPSSLPSSRSRFVVGSHTPQFARRRAASVKRFRRLLPEDVARMQRKNSSGSCLVADYDGMLHENGYSLGFTPLPNTFPLELALRGV
ncbi:hypothetical protein KP509_28G034500 [Ceratopteris richardii]|uniref:Uncharacterized protein n=1 Tax=Ceratopteris richardii TaxID=49495 RepID=A0A8T2RCW4_CERRI|nr:hypothetical protein KP509_28G034500 [Ceratopteris richardii]